MRVLNPKGSKERLFEMFEKVNKIKLKESYEVHYSDGVRQKETFNHPDDGVAFMKDTIKSNPNLKDIAMYDASKGFHSTADEDSLIYWWGDGSYFDNVSKKNPELNNKKLVKTNLDIEETFDSPKEKDEKYLDNAVGQDDSQVSKYDGGVDYPAIDNLKVNDPALEKVTERRDVTDTKVGDKITLNSGEVVEVINKVSDTMFVVKGDDGRERNVSLNNISQINEISWSGIKGAAQKVGGDIKGAVSNAANAVGNSIKTYADNIAKSYHRGARNKIVADLERMATKFGTEFGEMVGKINMRAQKAGDQPINIKSLLQTISNVIISRVKGTESQMNLGKFKSEGNIHEDGHAVHDEEFEDQLEGGLADDAEPQEFDVIQLLKGIEVEMEHTNDFTVALEIAMDHLMEIPDYYDRLNDMESNAEEESGEPSEESLLDPSEHWVDHYTAKNMGEGGSNYPHPMSDPEAGEGDYEAERELEDLKKKGELDENSEWFHQKNDPLPDDINIPIASMENNADILLGRQIPDIINGDQKNLLNRRDQIDSWKESFMRTHGQEGSLVKDDYFKNKFAVVGNESHASQMEKSKQAKGDFLNKEKESGRNPFMGETKNVDTEHGYTFNYKDGVFVPNGHEHLNLGLMPNFDQSKINLVSVDTKEIIQPYPNWESAKSAIKDKVYGITPN